MMTLTESSIVQSEKVQEDAAKEKLRIEEAIQHEEATKLSLVPVRCSILKSPGIVLSLYCSGCDNEEVNDLFHLAAR